eukprot:TRINITY_DN13702_c0_g1_i1.p1 TRINITY_DN13702_c0_g1~~TRINITY_DN13702_c0_g1_i1.p1  ORF type:complete len:153 (+),score=27.72 TRINITY_DN13702_c0_g1_i1:31-459(+)
MTLRSTLVSLFSGVVFSVGWWILIDGVVYGQNIKSTPPFLWFYYLPAVFATVCAICLNFAKASKLNGGGMFDDGIANRVRVWVFLFLAGSFMCIGGAIWVTAQHYGKSVSTPYPGVGLIVQTVTALMASLIFFLARGQKEEF